MQYLHATLTNNLHPFLRNIIKAFVPKQGEGPNQDMLDNGFMNIGFWGQGHNSEGVEVIVKGGVIAKNGDPGYR